MIKQRIVRVAIGAVLAAASTMAAADESSGWYFGVTGGQAQVDVNQVELDALVESEFASLGFPVISGSSTLEDSDTSWSAVGGYRFSRYFAVEGSFTDFGTAEYRASGTVNPPGPVGAVPASYSESLEASGFTAAALGAVPIGPIFELHARAGVLFAKVEVAQAASISGASGADSYSSSSRDLFFGFGVGLHFGRQWSANLDWQQFKDVGDEQESGEADIDRISLGLVYRL